MMIIYHFKERINVMEKKNETTIEILNNLAKELTGLRGFVLQMNSQEPPQAASPSIPPSFFHMISQGGLGVGGGFFQNPTNITIDLEDDENIENIPIEHLNIGEDLSNSIIEEDIDSEDEDEDNDDDISEVSENSAPEPEVQIEKIVVLDEPSEDPVVPVAVNLDVVDTAVSTETTTEDYTKLTTIQLKNIVLDKKIYTGNVNKLKRQELIKLLQSTA
jgi:hypothetical protein